MSNISAEAGVAVELKTSIQKVPRSDFVLQLSCNQTEFLSVLP